MSNKLKCVKHDRRIVATETSFLHKTGDCSPCDSKSATINSRSFARGRIEILVTKEKIEEPISAEEKLLKDVLEEVN